MHHRHSIEVCGILLMGPARFLLAFLLALLFSSTVAAKESWSRVDRIFAIGDIHGDYNHWLALLQDNQLIDSKANWQGGKTHLVQLGDVPDRGPDSLKVMRHLMQLQKQAKKAGGRVFTAG